jgi:hypothetical protein
MSSMLPHARFGIRASLGDRCLSDWPPLAAHNKSIRETECPPSLCKVAPLALLFLHFDRRLTGIVGAIAGRSFADLLSCCA